MTRIEKKYISALISQLSQKSECGAVENLVRALASVAQANPAAVISALISQLSQQTNSEAVGIFALVLTRVLARVAQANPTADYTPAIAPLISQLSQQSEDRAVENLAKALTRIISLPYYLVANQEIEVIQAISRFLTASGSITEAIAEGLSRLNGSLSASGLSLSAYPGIKAATYVNLAVKLTQDFSNLQRLEDKLSIDLGLIYTRANSEEGAYRPVDDQERQFAQGYLQAVVKQVLGDELDYQALPAVGAKVHGKSPLPLAILEDTLPGIEIRREGSFYKKGSLCLVIRAMKSSNNLNSTIHGLFKLS